MLALDFDSGAAASSITEAFDNWEYVAWATWRHCPDKPRYRVVLPFFADHDPALLEPLYEWVERELALAPDRSCCTPAHKFFFQKRPKDAPFEFWSNEGAFLDLRALRQRRTTFKQGHTTPRNTACTDVRKYAQNQKLHVAIMRVLGAPGSAGIGTTIKSLIVHESTASTWFYRGKANRLYYRCAHQRVIHEQVNGGEAIRSVQGFTLTDAEVLASQSYGKIVKFARSDQPEHAIWHLIMAYKLGLVSPLPLRQGNLDSILANQQHLSPERRTQLRSVWRSAIVLIGLRSAHNDGLLQPTPLSWRFGAALVKAITEESMCPTTFGAHLTFLMQNQLLVTVATHQGRYGKTVNLLLPRACIEDPAQCSERRYLK